MGLNTTTIARDADACFAFSDLATVTIASTPPATAQILYDLEGASEAGDLFQIDNDGQTSLFAKRTDLPKFKKGISVTDTQTGITYTIVRTLLTADPLFCKIIVITEVA